MLDSEKDVLPAYVHILNHIKELMVDQHKEKKMDTSQASSDEGEVTECEFSHDEKMKLLHRNITSKASQIKGKSKFLHAKVILTTDISCEEDF